MNKEKSNQGKKTSLKLLMKKTLGKIKKRSTNLYLSILHRIRYFNRKRSISHLFNRYNIKQNTEFENEHLILIVIDCWRRKHLKFFNYHRNTTPFLISKKDSLAIFKCITNSSWTYPSVPSILSGLYPSNHGAIPRGPSINTTANNMDLLKINSSILTMLDLFKKLDFEIFYKSGISYVYQGLVDCIKKIDLQIGTENVDELLLQEHLTWLENHKEKNTFSYLHLESLHTPIHAGPFKDHFGKVKDLPNISKWDYRTGKNLETESFREYYSNKIKLYDSAMVYLDSKIQELYEFLEKKDLLESTTIIITADHGEEFWEHAHEELNYFINTDNTIGIAHGHNLWNELIDVPLLFMGKKINSGEYLKAFASSIDIFPTILNLYNIDYNKELIDGIDLFSSEFEKKRPIFSEATINGYEKKAVIKSNYKLLSSPGDGIEFLFNLEKDPKEKNPIKTGEHLSKLKNILSKYNSKITVKGKRRKDITEDKIVEERLRNLGYID